jgi:hypothetical protein
LVLVVLRSLTEQIQVLHLLLQPLLVEDVEEQELTLRVLRAGPAVAPVNHQQLVALQLVDKVLLVGPPLPYQMLVAAVEGAAQLAQIQQQLLVAMVVLALHRL